MVHSGLQVGGEPTKPGSHEHAGPLDNIWHFELGPHGEGVHDGGRSVTGGNTRKKIENSS